MRRGGEKHLACRRDPRLIHDKASGQGGDQLRAKVLLVTKKPVTRMKEGEELSEGRSGLCLDTNTTQMH